MQERLSYLHGFLRFLHKLALFFVKLQSPFICYRITTDELTSWMYFYFILFCIGEYNVLKKSKGIRITQKIICLP
jgi:hypothetical protein